MEKVTVSMANLGSSLKHNELLAIPGKETTIISPIFNSQVVVSTSTPSLATNQEQEHANAATVQRIQDSINSSSNITSECLEKSYQSTTNCQVSSNQGLIRIVSDRDKLDKPTRNSTLIELDKCIAEFDKYKYLSDDTDSAPKTSVLLKEKDVKSNVNNKSQNETEHVAPPLAPPLLPLKQNEAAKPSAVIDIVKPPTLHYYHQSSLPNRPIQDIFSPGGAPPPLPPPLPSTWSSKDFMKTSLKKE